MPHSIPIPQMSEEIIPAHSSAAVHDLIEGILEGARALLSCAVAPMLLMRCSYASHMLLMPPTWHVLLLLIPI
jgi:hypothetical protein